MTASVGCGSSDGAGGSATTQVTVSAIEVGRGVGADKRIDLPVSVFHPEDPVYVSVSTRGTAKTLTVKARFVLEDGRVAHEESETIAPPGWAVSEFHVIDPDGWPPGEHRVEVYLADRLQRSLTFRVEAHDGSPSARR